jgi:hypothetical protein
MTTPSDDPQHRAYHQSDPGRVLLREDDESEDGVFTVRMPIASTGEVRNEGDDPLSREEIEGMADQVDTQSPGVFLDHGTNMDIAGSRYSATGKVGEWQNPDLVENDAGETLLEADARLMDPGTLSESTGSVREALAALKAQVDRDIGLSSSIGWRDDESSSGGVDLMEASIVGIPADPRTTSNDAPAEALARAASVVREQDNKADLVEQFRAAVMGPNGDEQNRHLSGQQAEIAEQLLNSYRDEQGNGSVENFEDWLWSVAYHQYDDNQFHAAMTALQEFYRETTPLEDPVGKQFAPFLDERQDGEGDTNQNDMTDTDTETQSGDGATDPDGTNSDDGTDGVSDAEEFRSEMLEMQRTQTETLNTLASALREDDEDGDGDGDEEDDDDEDGDDDGGENSADLDDDRTVEVDGEELDVQDVVDDHQETLAALRAGGVDLDDVDLGDGRDVADEADTSDDAADDEQRDNQSDDDTAAGSAGWLE